MKFLIIQLSDVHFKDGENAILKKEDKLFEAIRNTTLEYEEIFLLVTGDTAFSGKESEYKLGTQFLGGLKSKVETYCNKKVNVMVIPGNHDCDFSLDNKARQNQLNIIQRLGDSAIDDSVIKQCIEVQKDFFSFREEIQDSVKPVYDHPLLSVYPFEYHLISHC